MRYIITVMSLLVLSGCAGLGQVERTSGLSLDQWRQVNEIKFLENPSGINYDSLGNIKGLSCKGSAFFGKATEEDAIIQLRIKAFKLNANAVLNPTCTHNAKTDWSNNCWQSWVCVGEAVLIK